MVHGKRPCLKDTRGIQRRAKPGAALGPKNTEQKNKRSKLTSVKNQIRAIKRLLAKGGLAPKAVAEQQRRLEQLTDTQEEHQKAEKQRKYASRYHKVRFFERVKIERQISQLKRQPQPADAEAAAERSAQLAALQDDLVYVTHFPKEEKYVSVLRQAEDPEAQAALDAQRARLRALARAQAADAALVAEPDEGRGAQGLAAQAFDQAADGSDQDDFFLASDDEGPGAAAVGSAAIDTSDAAAFERAADAAGSKQPAGLQGKGGRQRQRPLGMTAGRKPPAAKQPDAQPQKQLAAAMPDGTQRSKHQHQQLPTDRRQTLAGNAQHKRPMQKPFAFAGGPPAMQHRRSAPHTAGQHQQQRHQAARTTSDGKRFTNQLPKQTKATPAAAAAPAAGAAPAGPPHPSPGQPTRKRAEGGRKRRKKG